MRVLLRDPSLADEDVSAFLAALPGWITGGARTLNLRNNQHTFTAVLRGHPLIVKRYLNAATFPASLRPLSSTRPWRSWHAASRLNAAGVSTPRPLLLVATDRDLIIAYERLDATELYQLLRDPVLLARHEPGLPAELRKLFGSLANARATHGDLHARNILVDQAGRAWLIDLDGLRLHRFAFAYNRRRQREEDRLGASLEKARPSLREACGFTRTDSDAPWRWL